MASLDDERFERYLKQFRPMPPEPLAIPVRQPATRRSFAVAVWALVGASVLIVAVLITQLHRGNTQTQHVRPNPAGVETNTPPQALTLGAANTLLTRSQTVKAALDQLAFHFTSTQLPKGTQSALAVLSQENNL